MRAWLIFGILGIIAAQPLQERQKASTPQKNQKVEQQAPPPAIAPPPFRSPDPAEDQRATRNKASYWRDAFSPATWSNWILAIAAILAIFVGLWTLRAIQHQGEIMGRQIALQEAAMKQWIVLDEWKTFIMGKNEADDTTTVQISFDILNQTNWPLTLHSIQVKIDGQNERLDAQIVVSPSKPYRVVNEVIFNRLQMLSRAEKFVLLEVAGSILYEDILGKWIDYPVNGVLMCNVSTAVFSPQLRTHRQAN